MASFALIIFYDDLLAGVTILLSLTVFLQLVAETMPPTSDAVPLIGTSQSQWRFLGDNLVFSPNSVAYRVNIKSNPLRFLLIFQQCVQSVA